jgi:hypothetical protein
MPLVQLMSDKQSLWDRIVKKYGLRDYSFQEAVSWPFGEAIFNLGYDVMSDTTKARQFGFHDCVDTEEMLIRLCTNFRKNRFLKTRGICGLGPFSVDAGRHRARADFPSKRRPIDRRQSTLRSKRKRG